MPFPSRDQIFAILHYLRSSLEGKRSYWLILKELNHSRFRADEVSTIEEQLSFTMESVRLLAKGQLIFRDVKPFAHRQEVAIEALTQLKPDLIQGAREAEDLLSMTQPPSFDQISVAIALFGRVQVARDFFIRGYHEYHTAMKELQKQGQFEAMLPSTQEALRFTTGFVETWKKQKELAEVDQNFLAALREAFLDIPPRLRSHCHDINQILAPYRGGITFENLDFLKPEAQLWQQAGIEPGMAGFWKAFGFNPKEARGWLNAKFEIPEAAAIWRRFGFPPEVASAWGAILPNPALVLEWIQAGYKIEEAAPLIAQGQLTPQGLNNG